MQTAISESEMSWWKECGPQITEWLEHHYPEEGCGLLVEHDDGFRFVECENLANKYHELDPETYPRSAETFYIINPLEFRKAEDRGEEVRCIVHSHADVGDYFSDEDVAGALMPQLDENEPQEPSYPGIGYLVVSVRNGAADHATLFEFDPADDRGFPSVAEWSVEQGTFRRGD
jgi:proteasome lid subunit RPN8/RPN11